VEKVILEHPSIHEVSVIGVPDPKFGEGIKAICVLKPGGKLTEQELIDFVGGRIARYKKPGYVQFVGSLPKKEDGSIDRLAEAISRLKAVEQIIAVTHSEVFAEKAEHVIRLEKEAGISRATAEK
jgi:acyl-CoA synthetase (AMP-forming)/AMP-acid ligase II